MEQPKGFIVLGQAYRVFKLVKSLYGLKQVPIQWHEIDQVVLSHGFTINDADNCVYNKSIKSDHVNMCLYVNDILIFWY